MVFAALFSWIAFGKAPRTTQYVGAVLILVGLAAVTAGRVHHAQQVKLRGRVDDV